MPPIHTSTGELGCWEWGAIKGGAGSFITQPIHNIQYLQMAPKLAVIYQVGGTIKFNIQREDLEQEQSCHESFHSIGPWDGRFD